MRFAHTAGPMPPTHGKRQTGVRALYVWPIPHNSTVAQEWRKWESHLAGATAESANTNPNADSQTSAQPATSQPLSSTLPSTVLATGVKWNVIVEHCFLSRGGHSLAAGGGAANPVTSNATAIDPIHSRIMRVGFSASNPFAAHLVTPPAEQWLLTHNNIVVGAGLNSLLESIGVGGGGANAADFLQVKASHILSFEEYACGDFMIRIGTVRHGPRVQPVLALELEHTYATGTGPETFAILNELALRLGVVSDYISIPSESLAKLVTFGLSMSSYSMGHAALQYCNLVSRIKELLAQQQAQQQAQPQTHTHTQHNTTNATVHIAPQTQT